MRESTMGRRGEPLVSIVLPTYNGSRYIDESVASVLAQTYTNWELIVVDDASTDDTADKVAAYVEADPRIRVIRHETNRRLPAALNSGFAQATGEYFTWTSDDNLYSPNALAEMLAFLQTHPGVDIVYSDYTEIDEAGAEVARVRVGDPEELLERNPVRASFMYRRCVQDELGGYSEGLFMAEDYDFWLRASIHFTLAPLHRDLYRYRTHESSLTSRHPDRQRAAFDKALGRSLTKLPWVTSREKSVRFLRLARRAKQRGHALGHMHLLLRSAMYSPPFFTWRLWSALRRRLSSTRRGTDSEP